MCKNLTSPEETPDINPIEHLRDELERKLHQTFSSNISTDLKMG